MMWWHAATWGLAGGAAAGLASLMTSVIRAGFSWPWRDHPEQTGPRLFVFAGGLVLGGLVAAAMHGSISGEWPAFALGVGALQTVRGLVSGIEVSERSTAGQSPTAPQLSTTMSVPPEQAQTLREEGVGDGGR
jgi:hypothetical protein